MLTPISFKALSDDVLVRLGFPLPAIYELKMLVGNNEASTPNSSFSNRSEATLASVLSTGNITPIRAAASTTTDTLNVEELKTLADHLNLRSKSGQNQLVRIVVAEMIKVQVSVFLKNFILIIYNAETFLVFPHICEAWFFLFSAKVDQRRKSWSHPQKPKLNMRSWPLKPIQNWFQWTRTVLKFVFFCSGILCKFMLLASLFFSRCSSNLTSKKVWLGALKGSIPQLVWLRRTSRLGGQIGSQKSLLVDGAKVFFKFFLQLFSFFSWFFLVAFKDCLSLPRDSEFLGRMKSRR